MLKSLKSKAVDFLNKEDFRSRNILKNVLLSVLIKGGSILIGLVLMPLTIDYISPVQYGIWLTISSLVSWMSFFDVGMGNGLRNRLTSALASQDYLQAKKLVSSTYATLTVISLILASSFVFFNSMIDWRALIKVPSSVPDDIHLVVLIVFFSFCVQFVVQLITTVLTAFQDSAMSSLLSFLGQLAVLIVIIILRQTVPGSLLVLVTALTFIPLLVLFSASCVFYFGKMKIVAPSIKHIDFSSAKSILNLGGIFFIIQIGALVLFQTNNIVITNIMGPVYVTEYNIAYKLFSVIIMLFTVIMTPYWSAFTEAYASGNFEWMKQSLAKIRKLWFAICLTLVPLILVTSKWIYKIWIGPGTLIPQSLSFFMAFYVVGYTGMMLSCFFLNGVGKLRIQLILYFIVCIVNIPLSIYFVKEYGTTGVAISNVIIFTVMGSILWLQCSKIVHRTAKGIWNV